MNKNEEHLVHARALRADIVGAPEMWLPRRETIVKWLDEFLTRAAKSSYDLESTEAADLRALDQFLRKQKIPVA